MSNWDNLPKPFFVLAPMDDVTDTVFRQVIAHTTPPDLFFTEFVNVDALASRGRDRTLPRLRVDSPKEHPIIAQIWGKEPENFYKAAQDIAAMGFDGVDLNFGCPDKNVVRNGTCSALILPENRDRALEMIKATREGAPNLPLSVKTRLGFNEVDLSWHELLLKQDIAMLTIHGRTKKQMSKVPADWDMIGEVRALRDKVSPNTLIVGNGDVLSRTEGEKLAKQHGLDGIMIGRGVFQDPFVFAKESPWQNYTKEQRIALYRKHVQLFADTWQQGERKVQTLNKFCKVYIQNFEGAKELREKLMNAKSTDELLDILSV